MPLARQAVCRPSARGLVVSRDGNSCGAVMSIQSSGERGACPQGTGRFERLSTPMVGPYRNPGFRWLRCEDAC